MDVKTYSNDNFNLVDIMSEYDLKSLKNSILSGLNENILKFGSYVGAAVGIIFLIQLIKQVVAIVVNYHLLKTTLGKGFHLICSIFTSLTHYIIKNNFDKNDLESPNLDVVIQN